MSANHQEEPRAEDDLTMEDKARYPGLAVALDPGPPSFEALATARVYSRKPPARNNEEAAAMGRYYPKLFRKFSQEYGSAGMRFTWCTSAVAAASLTAKKNRWGKVHLQVWWLVNPSGVWSEGENVLTECVALHEEIRYNLRGASRAQCQELLYEVVATALAMLDRRFHREGAESATADGDGVESAATDGDGVESAATDGDGDYLRSRLRVVREQFDRAAKRTLQLRYIWGMFITSAFLGGLITIWMAGHPLQIPGVG
jgi:hypothetical protein